MDEFQYYATFNDQGEIRTVFRMGDPNFMFALYRDGYWRDAWYMYRRMTKGDGPDLITEEEALAAIAREPAAAEPPPTGPLSRRWRSAGTPSPGSASCGRQWPFPPESKASRDSIPPGPSAFGSVGAVCRSTSAKRVRNTRAIRRKRRWDTLRAIRRVPVAGTRNTIFIAPKPVPLAFNVKRVTIGIPRPSPEEHS